MSEQESINFDAVRRKHAEKHFAGEKNFIGADVEVENSVQDEVVPNVSTGLDANPKESRPYGYWTDVENIENEARRLLDSGLPLKQKTLQRSGYSGFSTAITRHYPGGFRALKAKLLPGADTTKEPGYWNNPENIEREAVEALNSGVPFSYKSLRNNGWSSLVGAVSNHYPGGLFALKEKLGLQNVKRPNGYWNDPNVIEEEARKHLVSGGILSESGLMKRGLGSLLGKANEFYPGGWSGLRERLGQPFDRKDPGFWEDHKNIEEEAKKALTKGIRFTQNDLVNAGLSSLAHAVGAYPGGLYGLREKLGIDQERVQRGFWQDTGNIEEVVRRHIEAGGTISDSGLKRAGMGNLASAISQNYPGGIFALREKLGIDHIQKPHGYWKNLETIENEAKRIVEQHGGISSKILTEIGMSSLGVAIYKYYPGGLPALQEKFGVGLSKKPVGYWTIDNIEREAQDFVNQYGKITSRLLAENNRQDLLGAIASTYEGGLTSLQEKLGIEKDSRPRGYWTEDNILDAAKQFLLTHGELNHVLMRAGNEAGLSSAITKFYPGGMDQLKMDLGLKEQGASITYANLDEIKRYSDFFGASNAADILYRLHPQFRGVPHERVKGMIAEYLGNFLLQADPLNLDSIEDKIPLLSEQNLREGLIDVWKNDVLRRLSEARHEDHGISEKDALEKVFSRYKEQSKDIDDTVFQEVFDEIREYYFSLFDIVKPQHIIDSLNGGREFPDFNQRINIKELEEKKRLLIADEMGIGKSASVILAKEILGVKSALIIVPSNVISVWQNFLSDKVDDDGKNIGYFRQGHAPRVLTVDDPQAIQNLNMEEYDYILLSQERLNETHMTSLESLDVGMLIVDEFHKLKNLREGVRAGHLLELAAKLEGENKYVALLSGTPVPNKVEDIAIALKLLYPDKFEDLDNTTLIRNIINGDIVDLRSLLLPRMQSKNLAESLDMPELTESNRYYQLEGLEKDIYETLLDDDELSATAKLQLLRQFLLNPELIDPTPGFIGSKIRELDQFLSTEIAQKDKIIFFVNDYTNGVIRGDKTIIDKLQIPDGVKVEIIDGPVNYHERLRIQDEIRAHEGKIVVFVSGSTADVGVDFSAADAVHFYNEPWSKFDKRQQLSRVFRPGVKNPIDSSTLIGRGTIEEGINRHIEAKERAVLKLLKGIPRTDLEKQLLERGDQEIDKSLGVNPELAEYYFSSWDRMNKIFAYVKERGEGDFVEFLRSYADQYAGAYLELGSRSYQANASRVSGTLIDKFVKESGQNPEFVRILDIASGPEMLRRHIPDGYNDNIYSLDINKFHFSSASQDSMVGSFLSLPIKDESIDYANLSLSWHYTSFAPGKSDLERIEVLAEANRVLKKGGRLVLNNIYSLDIKNEQLFEELVWALGFRMIPGYSGEASFGDKYNSKVFTLEKVEYPGMSPSDISELIGKDHYDGLKFRRSGKKIRDSRKVLEEVLINGEVVPLVLNSTDKWILNKEQEITALGEELKRKYNGVGNIPSEEVLASDFVRILIGNRYVLFKKIPQASGAVVVK